MNQARLIALARLMAPNIDGRCQHVSFLCVRNRILSIGTNSYQLTHPLAAKFGMRGNKVHSELSAIVHFPRHLDIQRATLYNVMVRNKEEIRLSAPCKACQKLIAAFNIRRVYYTNEWGLFEEY
jgi:deoxycytidylate deaminase